MEATAATEVVTAEAATVANSIVVRDGYLPADLQENLNVAVGRFGWRHGWGSDSKVRFKHWHHEILGTEGNNHTDAADRLFKDRLENHQPVKAAWSFLQDHLLNGKGELLRCYANLHTHGVEGYPHTDSKREDEHTIIFYMNPKWKIHWGGETAFYEDDEIIKSVMPKPNRMVWFPSNVLHCARAVSRICAVGRMTLMFKIRSNGQL